MSDTTNETRDDLRKRLNRACRPKTPERAAAVRIARRLHETDWQVLFLLTRYAAYVGIDAAQALCNRTLRIQKRGGVLLPDGSRRRTSGGVYLMLAKQSVPADIRSLVFSPALASAAPPTPRFQPPHPIQDRLQWDQRHIAIKRMIEENRVGTVTHIRCRIALKATSATPVDRLILYEGNSTSPTAPAMPRGSVAPTHRPSRLRVLTTRHQANRLSRPGDSEDQILLEGYPCLGADGHLLVLARRVHSLNRLAAKPMRTWKEPWRRYLWATRGRPRLQAKLQKLGIEWKPPERPADKVHRRKQQERRTSKQQRQKEVFRQQVERDRPRHNS